MRFLGCSLRTDFELFGRELRAACLRQAHSNMNDYQEIRIAGTPRFYWVHSKYLTRGITASRHCASLQWLQEQLKQRAALEHEYFPRRPVLNWFLEETFERLAKVVMPAHEVDVSVLDSVFQAYVKASQFL